jgi:CRP-like cAMP-binding protein
VQAVWPTAERLGPKRVQAIARCVRFFHVKRGDVIIREGEPGRTFYILVSGKVDVHKKAAGVVAQLKPGDSFGEIALMHGQTTRSATIQARATTTATRAERDAARVLGRVRIAAATPSRRRKPFVWW